MILFCFNKLTAFSIYKRLLRPKSRRSDIILITNKTIDKKSSHNPYTQDYAQFFV